MSQAITIGNAKKKWKKKFFIIGMLALPIIHFAIFFVYININTIVMTFQNYNWTTLKVEYGLVNYKRLFSELTSNPEISKAIVNSIWVLISTNLILLPLSIVCGYFIYKKVRAHNLFRYIFFTPSMISIVVMTMVFSFMLSDSMGPINETLRGLGFDPPIWLAESKTALGSVLLYTIWVGIGFNMLLLSGAISRLPTDVLEYSRIDGVGMFRELTQIIMPMIWPTITTLLVMGTTSMFTMFLPVKMLTAGNPNGASATVAFYINQMVKGGSVQLEWAATLGIFFSIIGIPIIFGIKWLLERVDPNADF